MKYQASLVLTLLSVSLFSEIDIQTLSDWTINDFDPQTLFVAKGNQTPTDRKGILGFEVARPHCFATNPTVMMKSAINQYSDGDTVIAQMIIDENKPKILVLERLYGFEDDGHDLNWFRLKKFPSFAESKRVEVKFKKSTPLVTMSFDTVGIQEAVFQAENICKSPVEIQNVNSMDKI